VRDIYYACSADILSSPARQERQNGAGSTAPEMLWQTGLFCSKIQHWWVNVALSKRTAYTTTLVTATQSGTLAPSSAALCPCPAKRSRTKHNTGILSGYSAQLAADMQAPESWETLGVLAHALQ